MMKEKLILLLLVLSLLPAGCVTHTFLIDFTSGTDVQYKIEGDELDIDDERIGLPDSTIWQNVDRQETVSEDGSKSITLIYKPRTSGEIVHPIGPGEAKGILRAEKTTSFFTEITRFEITFPSWNVLALYGDPDAFVAEETHILDEEGAEELLPPEEYKRLENLRLQGLVKGAAQRYLMQAARLAEEYYLEKGEEVDSLAMVDAVERFSAILRIQLLTLKSMEAEDVSLEWYSDLRYPMATAVSEATGADLEWCLAEADKHDERYKAWLDMKDDNVEVNVILPAMFTFSKPDTSMGDTLVWSIDAEDLAENNVILTAKGYTPNSAFIVLLIVILAGVITIVVRKYY